MFIVALFLADNTNTAQFSKRARGDRDVKTETKTLFHIAAGWVPRELSTGSLVDFHQRRLIYYR